MQNRLPVLGKVPKNRRPVFRQFQRHFLCKIGSQFRRQFQQNRDSIFGSISEKWGASFGPAKLSPISGAAIKNLIRNDFAWPVLGPQKGPIFGHQKLGPGLIFGHFLGAFWDMKTGQFLDAKVGSFGSRFWIHFGNSRFWFCAHL